MAWLLLFTAGLLEVVWAFYMKQSGGFARLLPSIITLVAMVTSFALLAAAMKTLPLGTAYTIWVGIGAVGAFVLGVMLLGEPVNTTRLCAVVFIIAGIVLMKLA